MQNNITDEQLLDEEITIVPSTLSPGTFSTQVSQRLGIRSLSKRIADAARPNDTNINYCNLSIYSVSSTSAKALNRGSKGIEGPAAVLLFLHWYLFPVHGPL